MTMQKLQYITMQLSLFEIRHSKISNSECLIRHSISKKKKIKKKK